MGRAYDAIGNPTGYNGWTYTWTQGRRLQQASNASVTASYKYNASGIRTEKTVNGTTTKYNVVGGNVTWQKTGANNPIYFLYDASGSLWGLKYTDGNTYFYVRNVQGDIIKIVNSSGTVVVEYSYDAWGNPMGTSGTMAATLGAENPFRYRGYYYDTETGLYYLQSRYYNPEWGRYINADGYVSTGRGMFSSNMFAYCGNNPIIQADPSGNSPILIVVVVFVVVGGAIIGGNAAKDSYINSLNINDAEKELAKKYPFSAYRDNEAKKLTKQYIDKVFGAEMDVDNNQANAYRHAMWSAIMTDMIGEKKAKLFADAHENIANNNPKSMEMDLHNNALGRRVATEYAGQGYDVFSDKIIEAINNGEAIVLKWD